MKKSIIVLFMLMLTFTIFLTGCSSVSYTIGESSSGEINQVLVVELDSTSLSANGVNTLEILNKIETKLTYYKNSCITSFLSRLNADETLSESEKLAISSAVAIDVSKSIDASAVTYSARFTSSSIYYYFNDIDVDNLPETDEEVQQGFLFDKIVQKNKTIYSNAVQGSELNVTEYYLNEMKLYIESNYSTAVYNALPVPKLTYCYVTPERKLLSNADTKQINSDGDYVHTWSFSADNSEKEIEFYQKTPRRIVWYGLAITLTGVFLIVLFIVLKYFDKKKKKEHEDIIDA